MLPPVPGSIASVLLSTAPLGESVVEMMRAASIGCNRGSGNDDDDDDAPVQTWEVVLSPGTPEDGGLITKPLDVVVLGHSDG